MLRLFAVLALAAAIGCRNGTEPIGHITALKVNPDSIALAPGQSAQLHLVFTVEGGRAGDTTVTWKAIDRGGVIGGSPLPNGLTISETGVVTLSGFNGGFACATATAAPTIKACAAVGVK